MSLDDDLPPIVAHRRERDWMLRRPHDWEVIEEADPEQMFLEGLANLRREQPWRFWPQDDSSTVDARCFPSMGTDETDQWRTPPERTEDVA